MRYLVTGAAGLLGNEFASCLPENSEVYRVMRSGQGIGEISVDLSETNFVRKLPNQVDVIVHLAQSNLYRNVPEGHPDIFAVNVNSTFQLLEYARMVGASKFVYASSGSVYHPKNSAHEEAEQIIPGDTTSFYAASKLAAESLVMSYSSFFEVYVPRYFFLFGPQQNQNMLLPKLLNSLRRNDEIQLAGDRGISINPTPVSLAASVTLDLLNRGETGITNVASSNRHSLFELVVTMAKLLGVEPKFTYQSSGVNVLASTVKLSRSTHLSLEYNLEDLLREFISKN